MTGPPLIEKIRRPLDFLSRQASSRLSVVSGIEKTLSAWIDEVLKTHSGREVQGLLKDLRKAFSGFDALPAEEKRRRVNQGKSLLPRLEALLQFSPSGQGPFAQSIQFVKGVGPRRAQTLARLGISTVGDALYFLPRQYADRSRLKKIRQLVPGAEETLLAEVHGAGPVMTGRGRRMYEVIFADETGWLTGVWFTFRPSYMTQHFPSGRRFLLSGMIRQNPHRGGRLEIYHPEAEEVDEGGPGSKEPIHLGRIVPIYPSTEGLHQRTLRALMKEVVEGFAAGAVETTPPAVVKQQRLIPLSRALQGIHFPPEGANVDSLNQGRSPGHRRLIFDELFSLQVGLALRRAQTKRSKRRFSYRVEGPLTEGLQAHLDFALTTAQKRVIGEIAQDLSGPFPMNRLLQGDVGSGKTLMALQAILMAVQSGYQAAFMVPTEVLAEQHAFTIRGLTEPLGVPAVLLTGRLKGKSRTKTLEALACGEVAIAIGTHALIQEDVRFKALSLAVIDEQHRFGVMQRSALREKGETPDILVMTATPIPRTLTLTAYGDLDLSVLDELPPGRQPVKTQVFTGGKADRIRKVLKAELKAGHQAYVVLPLVEETERSDLNAAVEMAERIRGEFPQYPVGLLHGQMKGEEKERMMRAFAAGEVAILAATTVVEVGVDVPNATVMWVEHAERFGLSQLHQLRGRVGRGGAPSFCFLHAYPPLTEEAKARLKVMSQTQDGFVIAEKDLQMRGPGEILGTRQTGVPELRLAHLLRHAPLLAAARQEAFRLVEEDPDLRQPTHENLRSWVNQQWGETLHLVDVG